MYSWGLQISLWGPTPCGYFDWKIMIEQFICGGLFWPHVAGPKLRITVIRVVHEGLTGQGLTSHYMAAHDPVFGVYLLSNRKQLSDDLHKCEI